MKIEGVDDSVNDLGSKPIGRLLWDYSVPAVVGMLVTSLYNVIDRIFIGRGVGADAIAGLAVTFPVMNIASALGILLGAGAAARTSVLLGQNNRLGASRVLGNTLVMIFVNAIIYLTLFAFFLDPILIAFGASEVTLPYAHEFMAYLMPGMLVMNVMYTLNNIMRASGFPKEAMFTMFIGSGCNLVLAPIFIFILDMGIKGAAIATDISMTVGMIFVLRHFMRKDISVRFQPGIYRLRWPVVGSIIAIGAAPSIINFASSAINVVINRQMLHYGGDIAIGAVGIFSTYTGLICMIVVGICQGVQPILGYNYGAGHLDRLRKVFRLASIIGIAVTSLGAIFSQATPRWIAMAFTTDAQLIDATAKGLFISTITFCFVGFQIISTTLFQSINAAGKAIFLSLVRQVLFLVPLLIWLPDYFGLEGVWASFPVADVFSTSVSFLMVWWEFRTLRRRRELKPELVAV